jgi:hypothetical protein
MAQCQFCSSFKTKVLNDILYCENCEIYFVLKSGSQLIKSLPVSETRQRNLNLCSSCAKKAIKNSSIRCRTFREYLKKLPYCKNCKCLNFIFLKNLFFKNFLLYKKIRNQFKLSTLFTLLAIWSYFEKYLILIYYYISISTDMTLLSFICTSFVMYHLNQYSFVRFILLIMCIYKILYKKSIYFEVPINLLSTYELDSFIDRLNINSSVDSNVYRYKKNGNNRNTSQPNVAIK